AGMPEGVQRVGASRKYALKKREEAAEGLERIAAGRAETALERLEGLSPDSEELADAIHGARQDMKKLRTIPRVLREELGEERYAKLNSRFREAAGALSESRDAEIKVGTLQLLLENAEQAPFIVSPWRRALERERDESSEGVEQDRIAETARKIE